MRFDLDEIQTAVQASARRFANDRLRPAAAARDREHTFPTEELRALAKLGLMGMNISADYGGSEVGVVAYSLAITEIARADASVAVTVSVNNMVAEVLAAFGSPEQRARHIPAMTSGDYAAGSFCLSEPGSGSDAAAMTTRARRTDRGWVLDGAKSWITSGTYAGVYLVWARTQLPDGADRVSAFVVDPQLPGITRGKPEEKMGQRGSDTIPVTFEGVELPEDALLGELGQGFKIAMMALDGGRIGVASLALGLGQEALHQALAYTQTREQFGQKLSQFQATQFKLADMGTELEAAQLLTQRAAWLKQQGDRKFTRQASMAKVYATETAWRVCDHALQLFGGYGYTQEYPVERLLRDARVTRIYEGTSEVQRIVIARELLGQGR